MCKIHNKKYEYYCIDCYEHLCKECLKLKKHINHNKNIIIEVQPNEQQLNIINKMIKYYEDNITNLERENIKKTEELKNQLKLYKDELNKRNELKINENKNKFKEELKLYNDKYILDIENIKKEYKNKRKIRKKQYKKSINEICKKYKYINECFNILYKNKLDNLDINYTNIIQKYGFVKKIDNIKNMKRLFEIIL